MYNHASKDYICPFCLLVQGIENEHNSIKQTDLVYQNDQVTSFIALRKWPNNVGHVLIIPNEHFENIYDLPIGISVKVQKTAKAIALAMIETQYLKGELWAEIYYEKELRQYDKVARCTLIKKPFWSPDRAKATPPADT